MQWSLRGLGLVAELVLLLNGKPCCLSLVLLKMVMRQLLTYQLYPSGVQWNRVEILK